MRACAVPARLSATVLDTPDPRGLAAFYAELLGWRTVEDSSEWVVLRPLGGGVGLSFQRERQHVRPTWPAEEDTQRMQLHLDIEVDDLGAEVDRAVGLGASVADVQPQPHVRVLLDPAGHPFCLFVNES
jgi:catechol 2,3-dioxygenase-like lactoylglutathione lyase family enzyme